MPITHTTEPRKILQCVFPCVIGFACVSRLREDRRVSAPSLADVLLSLGLSSNCDKAWVGLQYGYDPSGHIAWNCRKKLNFGSSNEVDDFRINEVGKGESMSWVKKIPPQFLNYFNHQSGPYISYCWIIGVGFSSVDINQA